MCVCVCIVAVYTLAVMYSLQVVEAHSRVSVCLSFDPRASLFKSVGECVNGYALGYMSISDKVKRVHVLYYGVCTFFSSPLSPHLSLCLSVSFSPSLSLPPSLFLSLSL